MGKVDMKEFEFLKEKEEKGIIADYESYKLRQMERVLEEDHIAELLKKNPDDLTEDEEEELENWSDTLMREMFTIVGER